MQPSYLPLVKLFGSENRHTVPLFQRPYVWDREGQWAPLWVDIADLADRVVRAPQESKVAGHFLGTVVLEQETHSSGTIARREIIDGQQRLTTLQIILQAARHAIEAVGKSARDGDDADGEKSASVAARQLGALTFNPAYGEEEEKYKVWPTNEDRAAFREVMDATTPADLASATSRMAQAYQYFYKSIETWLRMRPDFVTRAVRLTSALKDHVRVIVLDLEGTDEPQAIFETLNAHGTPLLPADLMKNWFLWEAPRQQKSADSLYRSYWKGFDVDHAYWRALIGTGHAARARVDTFLQNWLTRRTGEPTPAKHLYDRFLRYAVSREENGNIASVKDVEALMADIHTDAGHFKTIEKPEGNRRFDQFLRRVALLDVVVFYPVILELMSRRGTDASDLDDCAAIIESYLVRRMVCAQQTRGYGSLAISMLSALKDEGKPAAPILDEYLSGLDKSLAWPDDKVFAHHWRERPLYGSLRQQRIVMLLTAIEEHYQQGGSKSEPIVKFNFQGLQIEHVLPRGWREHWPLKTEDEGERDVKLNTIGNLTLVTGSLNPSLSNAPWLAPPSENQKRQALSEHSRLQLNARLVSKYPNEWHEAAISERAEELYSSAMEIWRSPNLSFRKEEARSAPVGKKDRLTSVDENGAPRRIEIIAEANPKRPGSQSHKRFALYRDGQTIEEYKAACEREGFSSFQARADLRWDSDHGFIRIA